MRVRLIAAGVATVVRLVTRVDVRMLFPVRTIGEATVAAHELTLKWFLTCINTPLYIAKQLK
jgi:hypothetical protein